MWSLQQSFLSAYKMGTTFEYITHELVALVTPSDLLHQRAYIGDEVIQEMTASQEPVIRKAPATTRGIPIKITLQNELQILISYFFY